MLKQDERNKFFRDVRWSLDIETNEDTCKKCCEAQGAGLGPNECRKLLKGTRRGNLDFETRCMQEDIEARWPQKIGEREASGRGKSVFRFHPQHSKILSDSNLVENPGPYLLNHGIQNQTPISWDVEPLEPWVYRVVIYSLVTGTAPQVQVTGSYLMFNWFLPNASLLTIYPSLVGNRQLWIPSVTYIHFIHVSFLPEKNVIQIWMSSESKDFIGYNNSSSMC